MKKILLGTVIALSMAAPALAADLPVRAYSQAPTMIAAIYDWSGFYLGLNGGGGWARKCWDLTQNGGALVSPAFREGCADATGGLVGGQLGYRWQSAAWVFGIEAMGDWANLKGSNPSLFFGPVFGPATTNQTKANAIGLFTGSVGVAINNVLLYVKGGGAGINDKYFGINTATGAAFDSAKETRWGGTVGAGIEFGFAPHWSAAIEYDHAFMGSRAISLTSTGVNAIPVGTFSRTDTIRQDVDLVTARINYTWGGPVVAKY
jgi:outer membrane immunogenic protein